MPTLLAFGDSNTYGTPPLATRTETRRHDAATRWPTRAAALLGPGWTLVEEGLPGRAALGEDPVTGLHLAGILGLRIALMSHGPLDWLALMLGTNDVKDRFGATPDRIAGAIAAHLDLVLGPEMQLRHPGLRVLVICPPPVEARGVLAGEFRAGPAKSRALAPLLADLAAARGQRFLDAGAVVATSPVDGVHLDPSAHARLAQAVAQALGG